MLESQCHEHSLFATLTYEKEPDGASIHKSHLQRFIKRLRKRLGDDLKIRFFAVGEYGEIGNRPHYHAALFGIPPTLQDRIQDSWQAHTDPDLHSRPGFVHIGVLNADSAQYIAGYCTKKLTGPEVQKYGDRTPEFALMSRRPGLGIGMIEPLIEALNTSEGALYMSKYQDVPTSFLVGGRMLPLGPYIRGKLRLFFFGEETQPNSSKEFQDERIRSEIASFVPSLQLDPELFTRLATLENPHLEDYRRQLQKEYIHKKEMSRKQRSKQIAFRHSLKKSKEIL